MGDYYGGFHHIATSTSDPGEDLTGHLLDTNGVVSADYAVQLYHKTGELKNAAIDPSYDELPVVGSPAYVAAYGSPKELAPDQSLGFGRVVGAQETGLEFGFASATPVNAFVPARPIAVPEKAVSFISEDDAKTIAARAPMRAFTDPLAQYWAEQLAIYYKYFYDEISFTVDWPSDDVNAYAWIEDDGLRRVDMKSGLVRTEALKVEALALIFAHEIGHHYGGPPLYPTGDHLSCEGQADFFGARNVMRRVWFGEFYITMMDQAIAQIEDFFGFVPMNGDCSASLLAGCSHPTGTCRIETYKAAVALLPKPACAG
jgi:hypothetical protein